LALPRRHITYLFTMPTSTTHRSRIRHFLHFHSLSLGTGAILGLWIVLYCVSNPSKHAGAFFGNAIADWSGSLVIILTSRYLIERTSGARKPFLEKHENPVMRFVGAHSLSVFLAIMGLGWLILYLRMDPNSRWGQVVGNIVSEWGQTLGLVLMTKRLAERTEHKPHPKPE
jgi:hypothetical protein